MPDIRVLSAHLVNKIAAGEVIERPASVVKELVENALDAGASAVDVTVEDGGRRLIRVRDNGGGMDAEDLALAMIPHATSKIVGDEDLFNIRTMGFRGEALASIAAVSRVHVVTRRRGSREDGGYEIRAEGDTIHAVRPAPAAADGTAITVKDLFYNTPARRKFMRTANTESSHVVEQLIRLALPNCRVSFTLTHNGRLTHRLASSQTLCQRTADLLGAELAQTLIEFSGDERSAGITGLIAPPHQSRASAKWQYFFVNGRYVRDRVLSHALREAYRGLLEPSRSPVAIVFLDVDPARIDVNVHPTKIEVRFRDGQFIHSQLLGVLRETLNKADIAPRVQSLQAQPSGDIGPAGLTEKAHETGRTKRADETGRESLKQTLADFFKSTEPAQGGLEFAGRTMPGDVRPASDGHAADSRGPTGQPGPRQADWPRQTHLAAGDRGGEPIARDRPASMPAMQIHNAYIVAASDEGLAIIDQHALHERILFDDLARRISSGRLTSQRLLIPETVEVGQSDKAILAERDDLLGRLGLDLTDFGPGTVAVHAMPGLLVERRVPAAAFVRDLLDLLSEHASADGSELLEMMLATMACKAAVKAGDPLTAGEIDALLARRADVENSGSCPHGRPTTLVLTLPELEKQFKRK